MEAGTRHRNFGTVTAFVYILRCNDGRYYVGSTRDSIEARVNQHQAGIFGGFTESRRPVTLVYSQEFDRIEDAIRAERQVKGWTRAKKEALIRGDMQALVRLAKNRTEHPDPSTGSG